MPCSEAQIAAECGIDYEGRSGLIALLHRPGMEHRKPQSVSRKMDPARQEAFIKSYNDLLNSMLDDEAVLFADAVHPTHAVRPVGCRAPKDMQVAVEQTSGRDRLNIHGAIDLETGTTCMLDVETVNAVSTIRLHFIPTYCPHLDPIERLWGLMHKNGTHNRCYAKFKDFRAAILAFLREAVPQNWGIYCDSVSNNFRIISPKDFRVLT